ncbi:MAG: hypothetical protein ACLR8L_00075 [Oscillospiraceae bacterium]
MTLVKLCEGIPEVRGTFFQYDGALYYKTKGCFQKITKERDVCGGGCGGAMCPSLCSMPTRRRVPATPISRKTGWPTGKTVWYNAKTEA